MTPPVIFSIKEEVPSAFRSILIAMGGEKTGAIRIDMIVFFAFSTLPTKKIL